MKHFLTASAMLFSFLAAAQFPNLPYNPDENGDGLIGVVDLQGLLANYGNEFASAVVSEDGENAITFMGEMAYPLCATACEGLPGMWQLPSIDQLGLIWDEVNNAPNTLTWLIKDPTGGDVLTESGQGLWGMRVYQSNGYMYGSANVSSNARCYCAAKQLPRVEYTLIYGGPGSIQSSAEDLIAAGWMPLDLALGDDEASEIVQTFWRWAE